MTNFRMTVSWLCCSRMEPPPSVYESSCPPVVGREGVVCFQIGVQPPPLWLSASEIKQTFLSTELGSFLAFGWWSAGPHFWLYEQRPEKSNKPEALESSSLLLRLHCGFKEASCHASYSREKVHFANDLRNLDVTLSAFRSVTRT